MSQQLNIRPVRIEATKPHGAQLIHDTIYQSQHQHQHSQQAHSNNSQQPNHSSLSNSQLATTSNNNNRRQVLSRINNNAALTSSRTANPKANQQHQACAAQQATCNNSNNRNQTGGGGGVDEVIATLNDRHSRDDVSSSSSSSSLSSGFSSTESFVFGAPSDTSPFVPPVADHSNDRHHDATGNRNVPSSQQNQHRNTKSNHNNNHTSKDDDPIPDIQMQATQSDSEKTATEQMAAFFERKVSRISRRRDRRNMRHFGWYALQSSRQFNNHNNSSTNNNNHSNERIHETACLDAAVQSSSTIAGCRSIVRQCDASITSSLRQVERILPWFCASTSTNTSSSSLSSTGQHQQKLKLLGGKAMSLDDSMKKMKGNDNACNAVSRQSTTTNDTNTAEQQQQNYLLNQHRGAGILPCVVWDRDDTNVLMKGG